MKNERLNGGSGYKTFVVDDTLLEKYNGNAESVRLPGFICGVGDRAFAGNESLKNISLSSSVIAVGENAFDGCKSLEEVNLPYELNFIGKLAFNGCEILQNITFNGTKERWLSVRKGELWFEGTADFTIHCRDGDITKQEETEFEYEAKVNFTVEENKTCVDPCERDRELLELRHRELLYRLEREMDDDDDDYLDNKFAEYERYLKEQLVIDDADEEDCRQISMTDKLLDKMSKTKCVKDLASVLSRISVKKQDEITADKVPSSSMWFDEDDFDTAVMDRLEKLVRSDLKMARRGAIKKAETYLEAVRDTRDGQMMQVYERIVYELKITSDSLYNKIRNCIRNE